MQIIAVVTKDPAVLPQASEELILESKTNINLYPDSPGGSNSQGACSNSLGSRKSSVCSISSMNSSSSGSPGHQFQRSLSQVRRNRDVNFVFYLLQFCSGSAVKCNYKLGA